MHETTHYKTRLKLSRSEEAREQEEDIARQHSPITNEIFAYLLNRARDNTLQDSFEAVTTDFLIKNPIIGSPSLRVCTDNAE